MSMPSSHSPKSVSVTCPPPVQQDVLWFHVSVGGGQIGIDESPYQYLKISYQFLCIYVVHSRMTIIYSHLMLNGI
jgi:hypothetical protein